MGHRPFTCYANRATTRLLSCMLECCALKTCIILSAPRRSAAHRLGCRLSLHAVPFATSRAAARAGRAGRISLLAAGNCRTAAAVCLCGSLAGGQGRWRRLRSCLCGWQPHASSCCSFPRSKLRPAHIRTHTHTQTRSYTHTHT